MIRSLLLALALSAGPAAADEGAATLSIEIAGLAPGGAVMLQMFDSEAGYQSGQGGVARMAAVSGESVTVRIEGLAPGQYAFRLFHDVNGDGRMNTNPFGVPVEPFAFSNNARGHFGPASWQAAAFTLDAGANTHRINLREGR